MAKILITIGLILLWIALVVAFFIGEEKLSTPDVEQGNIKSIENYVVNKLNEAAQEKRIGCAAFGLIQNGEIVAEYGFGIANNKLKTPVKTDETLFLLSSLSKAVTTWGVMKLVQEGKLNLDEPVIRHLKRWQFPGRDSFRNSVTTRHLLTHTSGIIDGYGLSGVLLSEKLQTIEEWLSMPKDANMGQSHPTTVTLKPGTAMSYSTAGYGVLQLLIEETTGKPFSIYMKEAILEPLGMSRSNYDVDAIIAEGRMEVLAANYDLELKVHPVRHYANKAGASLRSTLHDLCVFATSYFKENSFLNKKTMKLMLTPQPATYLTWTLGHTVYGKYNNEGYIVGHGGGSFPASGAEMRLNPATGNGIIIIGSGTQNLISELTEVWTYWETGKKEFDVRKVYQNRLWHIIIAIVVGAIAIIVWEVVLKRKKTVPTLK